MVRSRILDTVWVTDFGWWSGVWWRYRAVKAVCVAGPALLGGGRVRFPTPIAERWRLRID